MWADHPTQDGPLPADQIQRLVFRSETETFRIKSANGQSEILHQASGAQSTRLLGICRYWAGTSLQSIERADPGLETTTHRKRAESRALKTPLQREFTGDVPPTLAELLAGRRAAAETTGRDVGLIDAQCRRGGCHRVRLRCEETCLRQDQEEGASQWA